MFYQRKLRRGADILVRVAVYINLGKKLTHFEFQVTSKGIQEGEYVYVLLEEWDKRLPHVDRYGLNK